MIKGVNKKVLEINNPQSVYFEKAVFYLKPNMSCTSEKLMKCEADELIHSLSPAQRKLTVFSKLLIGLSLSFSAVTVSLVLLFYFF